jgi:hypothetical protein
VLFVAHPLFGFAPSGELGVLPLLLTATAQFRFPGGLFAIGFTSHDSSKNLKKF